MQRAFKRLLVAQLLVVLVLYAAATAQTAKQGPRISVQEQDFNFGKVSEGAKVAHSFKISNNGRTDLVIQRVVAACGCTVANASTAPIPPGGSTDIGVEFDSAGFSGPVQKAVRIYSNDPDAPITTVSLIGTVATEVTTEPKTVVFDKVARSNVGGQSKQVRVSIAPGSSATIAAVRTFSKALQVRELEADATSRLLSISLSPEVPVGEIRERIVIELKGGKRSVVNVPVYASVQSDTSLEPAVLSFGLLAGVDSVKRRAKLVAADAQTQVKDVRSNHPALSANVVPAEDGKGYWIDVTLDPTKVEKDLRAAISINTSNSHGEEELLLNVYGVLPPKVEG
ncbi:MAG: DUF1573 domain-containing protein [Deltaproteobacteria bacterium]|nr:DUF1573 domain-containing protein [Deltaproteobacteria bacterium]